MSKYTHSVVERHCNLTFSNFFSFPLSHPTVAPKDKVHVSARLSMVHIALNQGVGYGIVLGLGAAFALGRLLPSLSHIPTCIMDGRRRWLTRPCLNQA